ncbi:Ppx/GppA phosphatase family protein [Ghiorsea bivora]|uniref:Ppx/GppA phosphatase family protein n=1 Tax=Ghiorsea bivora TaxID=1485545 RepID=UPI00056E4D15|nr:Ppx/GppA phosphatase family protein [Ghiorsea bivora]
MSLKTKAVLDIGSNTIRLLIAEVGANTIIQRIHYEHKIARLGEGLQRTGMLSNAGMQRALRVFSSMKAVCQEHGIAVSDIYAVATAAIREAKNGQSFVAEVMRAIGLRIQVISGEQEARLALVGARLGLPDEVGSDMCLFDIGGGSTEFTCVFQGQVRDSHSLKLGVVRLTEQWVQQQPVEQAYGQMKQAVIPFLEKLESFWGKDVTLPQYLVGTAGTVTTLAAIAQDMQTYVANKIDGYVMTKSAFNSLRDQLLNMSNQERLQIPALEKGREDVIIAGIVIIDVLFERWHYTALISVDSGLLEGLLLE